MDTRGQREQRNCREHRCAPQPAKYLLQLISYLCHELALPGATSPIVMGAFAFSSLTQ